METILAVKKNKNAKEEYGLIIFKRKFQGIFSRGKEKYLDFDYVKEFIDSLNILHRGLGDQLRQIFLTAVFPNHWQEIRQKVLDVGGFIGPILCKNPGSAKFMDLLYHYEQPRGPLDKLLMDCRSGRAVDYRKAATIKNIAPALSTLIQKTWLTDNLINAANVLNLGSGCGYDVIEMSRGSKTIAEHVKFINVDIDAEALAKGKLLLQKKEFRDLTGISFLNKNMLKVNIKNAIAAMVIGVLCGFTQRECISNLRIEKSFIIPGGIVWGACVTDRMVQEDLFTCFILELVLNWHLCYRKPKQVQEMFEAAGYIWRPDLTFEEEPTRYYVIGAGEVPSKTPILIPKTP